MHRIAIRTSRILVPRAVATTARLVRTIHSRIPSGNLRANRWRFAPTREFASWPDHTVLNMPALSPTMAQGTLAKWLKSEGDELQPGDVIAEVETDKATVDFECQDEGYLAKILVPEQTQDIKIGHPVAVIVEDENSVSAFKDFTAADTGASAEGSSAESASSTPSTPEPASTPTPTAAAASASASPGESPGPPTSSAASAPSASGRVFASPYARKLAREAGLDLSQIGRGRGPNGRIIAVDVEDFLATARPEAAAEAEPLAAAPSTVEGRFTDIPHTQMRRVIAARLTESKRSVPHYYLTSDIQLDALLDLRSKLNADFADDSSKLSVNDFIIKASALACKKVPEVNSSWMEDYIRVYDYVDVSVAVSTEDGLVTPIVKDADKQGLSSISTSVKELAGKARSRKLLPEEYQGGTITISNLGMYGVRQFSAIINPPQAAILAVGAIQPKVVPNDDPEAEKPYAKAHSMSVTLSCDHRVVDGAVGAQWLAALKDLLERPQTMLL